MIAKVINKDGSGRLIVEVEVNGKTAAMLIDNGSGLNILDENQLNDFGISKRFYAGNVEGVGGNAEAYHVKNCAVILAGFDVYQWLSMDLSNVVGSIKNETGIRICGLIGRPAFMQLEITINPSYPLVMIGM